MKNKRVRIRKNKKKHHIRALSLGEVSFVDKGDNPGAHVLLMKRKSETTISDILKSSPGFLRDWAEEVKYDVTKKNAPEILSILSKEVEAKTFAEMTDDRKVRDAVYDKIWTLERSLFSILEDDDVEDKQGMIQESVAQFQQSITTIIKGKGGTNMNRLEKLLASLKKANPDMSEDELMVKAANELATTVDEVEKAKTDLEDEKGTLTKTVEDLEKDKEALQGDLKKAKGEEVVEIDKSKLSPEVRKVLEKAEDDGKKLEKMQKQMQKDNFTKRAVVLKSCGDTDEIASLLIKIDDHDSELADEVEKVLASNAAIITASPLFKEKGHNSENDNDSAVDQLNKLAGDLMKTEAGAGLSKAQAFTKVMKDPLNAELKKQYADERNA